MLSTIMKLFFLNKIKQLRTKTRVALQPFKPLHELNQYLAELHEMKRNDSQRTHDVCTESKNQQSHWVEE